MTYGDPVWNSMIRPARDHRKDHPTPRKWRFVPGEPVPWMGAGEANWAWDVTEKVRQRLNRPHLKFVMTRLRPGDRSGALDDLAKPVLEVVSRRPMSLWVSVEAGERPGVRVGETAPPYPDRIDVSLAFPAGSGPGHRPAELLKGAPRLGGDGPVGAYLSLPGGDLGELGFGSQIRGWLDALNDVLGGRVGRPGKLRIRDLRVIRASVREPDTEVRLWSLERR